MAPPTDPETTENKLEVLKTQRASTKGCISRIKTLIFTKKDIQVTELECRLGILESYWKLLVSHQTSIERLTPNDDNNEIIRGELEDLYCEVKSKILSLLPNHQRNSVGELLNATNVFSSGNKPNLPKLKLPTFNGKYSEYPNFIAKFKQLVNDQDISVTEKYSHLLGCLSGPALRTVEALRDDEKNYDKALEVLKNRYDNPTIIFQEHVSEMFNLLPVSRGSSEQLRSLIDNINAHLGALKSLGSTEDILNSIIIHLAFIKLDGDSQAKWHDSIEYSNLPTWDNLANILIKRCLFLESREGRNPKSDISSNSNKAGNIGRNQRQRSSNRNTTLNATNSSCLFCSENTHRIEKCPKFVETAISERFTKIKNLNACINCLRIGHSVKQCKSSKCRVCSRSHHTLLHRYPTTTSVDSNIVTPSLTTNSTTNLSYKSATIPNSNALFVSTPVQAKSLATNETQNQHVFLATALVQIKDSSGIFHTARALLDSASQLNFITDRLVHMLRLKRTTAYGSVEGVGRVTSKIRHRTIALIKSCTTNYSTNLQMWVLPTITGYQPDESFNVQNWKIPQNVILADPSFHKAQKIDILIGADTFFELLAVGQIKLAENLPLLQKTVLGWIIAGRFYKNVSVATCNISVAEENSHELTDLPKIVEKFWEVEEVTINKNKLTLEEQFCEKSFIENVKQLQNGQLMVKLPFKSSPELLGMSFEIAKRRFYSLERRLDRNLDHKKQYSQFLSEYLNLEHMEPVSWADIPSQHYFIPHQCVLRPESSSTPLRVVFDASCRTTSNLSLNDVLAVGPTVQNDVFSIMTNFRCYKYALTADISKMYRQFLVQPEDRNFQLIIWRANKDQDFQIYRLKTITYGTASAPYLATRSLNYLADCFSKKYPAAVDAIKNSFYVDDFIAGADTEIELEKLKLEITDILKSAHLKLCKWGSNCCSFIGKIPEPEREKTFKLDNVEAIKTLGIVWVPKSDEFKFYYNEVNSDINSKITKRTVLSDLARLFDPLGVVNPIIVAAKIFMQELWLLKVDWDESLPLEHHHRWQNFKASLSKINEVSINRYVFQPGENTIELHGFSDASNRAYGCCVYIRCTNFSGLTKVNLLSAKSKVAPSKKPKTLPVLELLGAELLAKLLFKIKQNFKKQINSIYCWTDSTIVLGWLSSHASKWKTLVANRVSSIQDLTDGATWKHVDGKNNPADIVSRGATVPELQKSIWFKGPSFLYSPPEDWPNYQYNLSAELPQQRKITNRNPKSALIALNMKYFVEKINNSSNFLKIRRITAYIYRFYNNIKKRLSNQPLSFGILTAAELQFAFFKIIYCIQQYEFEEDIIQLQSINRIKSNSTLRCLNPFIDQETNLLRVGGRLLNSDLPYSTRCPILLPKKNNFVTTYIRHLHMTNFHAGPQALTARLQQQFWVINARDYTRKIVRSCIYCAKYRPRLMHQIMGHLPSDRTKISLPFSVSGVDFCGPFFTTHGVKGRCAYKTYIAVFVCFVSKGVHLEIVSSLSADAFIAALKRFISRRTLCKKLYCDNATNFVGSKRKLEEFRRIFFDENTQLAISKFCSENIIEFKHIPPRSPHFGGLWEAAVKSAKALLYPSIEQAKLTMEELSTVCCQIESILNSRPITQMSSDPNDEQALTPAHFWNQAPLDTILEPDMSHENTSYINKWKRISAIQQYFWRRWSREYVVNLQKRYKWQNMSHDTLEGALVLIHEDNLPPQKWLVGRIISVSKGPDNQIRVADVKTKHGIYRRAIHKLAKLPTENEVES